MGFPRPEKESSQDSLIEYKYLAGFSFFFIEGI